MIIFSLAVFLFSSIEATLIDEQSCFSIELFDPGGFIVGFVWLGMVLNRHRFLSARLYVRYTASHGFREKILPLLLVLSFNLVKVQNHFLF